MRAVNIAILGLGTVGSGTMQLLRTNKSFLEQKIGRAISVVAVVVKNTKKQRNLDLTGIKLTSNLTEVLTDDSIDLFFEATGDNSLGIQAIQTVVNKNKKIITANKALLAEKWQLLKEQLCNSNAIAFDAAVGGAIPIIRILKNGLAANKINAIYGIINGTCNYILSKMEQKSIDFTTALKEAMNLGYAEPNPTLDVGGFDAAHKLIIMMNLIHNHYFDFAKLYIEGIQHLTAECFYFAKKMDYSIKLLAITKKNNQSIQAHIHPTLVPITHPLAKITGVENAIFVNGNFCGPLMFTGAGAGSQPTASAMVSDMVQILTTDNQTKRVALTPKEFLPITEIYFEYFILLDVNDKIGVLKSICQIFYKNSISIKSMLQEDNAMQHKNCVKIILVTHHAKEQQMLAAIKKLKQENFVINKVQFIRIFNDLF